MNEEASYDPENPDPAHDDLADKSVSDDPADREPLEPPWADEQERGYVAEIPDAEPEP